MKYIIKIVLFFAFIYLGTEFYYLEENFLSFVGVISAISLGISLYFDLRKILDISEIDEETEEETPYWSYYDNYNNPNKVKYYSSEHKEQFTIVPEFNHKKNAIKEIESNNKINKNIIEIGDNVIVDDEEIEVDNTRHNKPIISKSALIEKPKPSFAKVTVPEKKTKVIKSDCIFVNNGDVLSKEQESVYRVLYKMLNKQELTPNQRYALLQSIFYVDIFSMSVIIYVDKKILNRSGLNETHLQKEIITKWVKKVLHDEDINVIFEDVGYTSLINYYLDKQKEIKK